MPTGDKVESQGPKKDRHEKTAVKQKNIENTKTNQTTFRVDSFNLDAQVQVMQRSIALECLGLSGLCQLCLSTHRDTTIFPECVAKGSHLTLRLGLDACARVIMVALATVGNRPRYGADFGRSFLDGQRELFCCTGAALCVVVLAGWDWRLEGVFEVDAAVTDLRFKLLLRSCAFTT